MLIHFNEFNGSQTRALWHSIISKRGEHGLTDTEKLLGQPILTSKAATSFSLQHEKHDGSVSCHTVLIASDKIQFTSVKFRCATTGVGLHNTEEYPSRCPVTPFRLEAQMEEDHSNDWKALGNSKMTIWTDEIPRAGYATTSTPLIFEISHRKIWFS